MMQDAVRWLGFSVILGWVVFPSSPRAESTQKTKLLKAGEPAPDFRLRALDGAMVKLSEMAYPGREKSYAKKHPVLLDFFRTDCAPCVDAMPKLIALHERHSPSGLKVLLIALLEDDDGRAKLERYLAKQKLPFPVVVDANQLYARRYLGDVVTLPATFLIDREGTLREAKYGATGSYEEHFGARIAEVLAAHGEATAKKP